RLRWQCYWQHGRGLFLTSRLRLTNGCRRTARGCLSDVIFTSTSPLAAADPRCYELVLRHQLLKLEIGEF
ncbi:MAG: hypothetical protein KKA48_00550, partial [Proteobacteria bacterium]|nr:hypothetical protein [Pseudomonadota bacterium]